MFQHSSTIRVWVIALVSAWILAGDAWGQRLDIATEPTEWQSVEVEGVVLEVRKYSFVIDQSDGPPLQIQLPPRTTMQLVLNRPLFDPVKRTVRVLPMGATEEQAESRIEYRLPHPARLIVRFNHERHRDRIMGAVPMRLNNYIICPLDFENAADASGTVVDGPLQAKDNRWVWITGDLRPAEVQLGFKNGRVAGFTILQLAANRTKVRVKGRTDGTTTIAQEIEFWPIQADSID